MQRLTLASWGPSSRLAMESVNFTSALRILCDEKLARRRVDKDIGEAPALKSC